MGDFGDSILFLLGKAYPIPEWVIDADDFSLFLKNKPTFLDIGGGGMGLWIIFVLIGVSVVWLLFIFNSRERNG